MITDYKIVSSTMNKAKKFVEAEVQKLLKEGWEPLGGLCMCVTASCSCVYYAQAMVKRDDYEIQE